MHAATNLRNIYKTKLGLKRNGLNLDGKIQYTRKDIVTGKKEFITTGQLSTRFSVENFVK
jgi:hypothetical protein